MIKKLCANDIMIEDVHVTSPDDLVAAANLKMVRCNIGGLPVVEGKKLVGFITHRDILLAGSEAMGLKVGVLMSKELLTVNRATSIKEITKIMSDTGVQRIPVVDKGNLIGLITQSSIIHALANNLD